ncbi:hypothetical protein QYF36_027196 [Acer negundo]|nr:hypothetical protein QYF36_027196 [Acer negundo]
MQCIGKFCVRITVDGLENNDHLATSIDPFETGWTPPVDRYFIDLMIEQINAGNKIDHTFSEQSWAHIVGAFNEKFGLQCDKYILESRYFSLMKQHNDICNLLKHGGFVWDDTQQMVMGSDDAWETYIKDYPDAIIYRNKFLSNFGDSCKIFGYEMSNGGLVSQDLELGTDCNALDMEIERFSEDLQCFAGDDQISNQHRKRPTSAPSDPGHPSKVQKSGNEMQNDLLEMTAGEKENKNHVAIESAIDALQAIPELDDELLLDACDLLEDEKKAKTFMALDFTLRKKWLLRKLRP